MGPGGKETAMDTIADFIGDIADVESSRDAMTLRRKSRDSHAVSPLLRKSLEGKLADVVVRPKSKAEVLRVVAAAVKHRIPITARGGGTANYGQSVPLHGGILLDRSGT
jgi:FAD/FMN-containing dehydrogenase